MALPVAGDQTLPKFPPRIQWKDTKEGPKLEKGRQTGNNRECIFGKRQEHLPIVNQDSCPIGNILTTLRPFDKVEDEVNAERRRMLLYYA